MRFEYRPALDGLRAIAVGSVVVYHLNGGWLPGGYLGVDIFFVLSGYLITSLLFVEKADTGRIDMVAFWARRVRRLLPALALMLAGVALYFGTLTDGLNQKLRGDLIAALFYVANWRFIASGQSYFDEFAAASPIRHTWSLAIEEQFYVIWPLVGLLLIGRRKAALGTVSVLGIAVSTTLMATLFDATNPSRAYYGSGARVHQILVGVLLAVWLSGPHAERIRSIGRRLLPFAAAATVIALFTLGDGEATYYRGGSLGIAVATGVIVAGLEGGHPLRSILAARPLVLIGLVSYGAYLWHWPVIIAVRERWGSTAQLENALAVLLITAALTLVSYRYVERPIRRRTVLFGRRLTPRLVLTTLPALSVAALAVILVSTRGVPQLDWAAAGAQPAILRDAPAALGPGTAEELSPSDNEGRDSAEASGVHPSTPSTNAKVVVLGDSVSVSLLPGFRSLRDEGEFELLEAATPACPIGYQPLFDLEGNESPYNDACRLAVGPSHEAALEAHPDVVIWHDLQSVLPRKSTAGDLVGPASDSWSESLREEWRTVLERFIDGGSRVVLILPPLRSQDPLGCRDSPRPSRCRTIQEQDAAIREVTRAFWDDIASLRGVDSLSVDALVCPGGYPCPADVDGVTLREGGNDQTHFTEAGAIWLISQLWDLISVGTTTG